MAMALIKYELLAKAKKIDQSINKQAPKMALSEIVKEVRDYRNGK